MVRVRVVHVKVDKAVQTQIMVLQNKLSTVPRYEPYKHLHEISESKCDLFHIDSGCCFTFILRQPSGIVYIYVDSTHRFRYLDLSLWQFTGFDKATFLSTFDP